MLKGNTHVEENLLKDLVKMAYRLGVSNAKIITTDMISVEDELAALCLQPRCEHYGLSRRCPPHTGGPAEFRELKKAFRKALVFKIDVNSESLLSEERRDIFQVLQGIAANLELAAIEKGYDRSRAYAGGSCKAVFCSDHACCEVLEGKGQCRNPDRSRPSMSGFGINVTKLMDAAGWSMKRIPKGPQAAGGSLATVCGLLLIGSA